ncbi:MAG: DUF3800 domain-containing protein, partial [Candidatus Sulfotelmatobacter sp.]
KPNTSCTIITPASLRSDCCSPSLRNAVRLPSGISVHLHRNTHQERKWVDMPAPARTDFANAVLEMCQKYSDISLHAIIVKKENVEPHIRRDPNKLYNFMVRLSLLNRLCQYDEATLIPDARSIKVESGNSLHDYLQIELWFTKGVRTVLTTQPLESKNCLGVQFADMLSGVVQSCVEDRHLSDYKIIEPVLKPIYLFFKLGKSSAKAVTK